MYNMATAVRPIPFGDRNQEGYTTEQLLSQSKDSDSASDSDESSVTSSASESDSEVSSSSSSPASSSEEEDNSSTSDEDTSDYSSDEAGRSAALVSRRPPQPDTSQPLTSHVVDTLGDMLRADNVAFFAWLIPATGISTMLTTECLACMSHFSCSENFPTLSYAATFKPEGYAFTTGMCLTAVFIVVSVVLFCWYVKLRTQQEPERVTCTQRHLMLVGYAVLIPGITCAVSLCGLAMMDMRHQHDAHIVFTVLFFISAWIMMIAVQVARKTILREDERDGKTSTSSFFTVLRQRSFWRSLRRWRRLDFCTAYTLAQGLLHAGLASTFLFGVFFLCANGVWPNPLGFTAVQEAFFEALAIVCQLLFMGTLSCELARVAPLVERSDYLELERSE